MYYANMLKIGITSRALFDLDYSHKVYIKKGLEAYRDYQISREDIPLKKGQAFSIVEKLLKFNDLKKDNAVEVFLLSRNSADTGLRIFNSIQHYKLLEPLLVLLKCQYLQNHSHHQLVLCHLL